MAVIRIINPNSNSAITAGMAKAVECLCLAGGPVLDCVTLAQGPWGVETLADAALAERLVLEFVQQDEQADAFVIGCYSDPGLFACREVTSKPVFGIQQCAALAAIARGGRFGVISLSASSVARHMRHLRQLGLAAHCAGDRSAGLTVAESESGAYTRAKLTACARQLLDEDHAQSVILGCTGMAGHRAALEQQLGVLVVEPTQAAASMAIGALLMDG